MVNTIVYHSIQRLRCIVYAMSSVLLSVIRKMLSGVGIVCFTASYSIAFILEFTRFYLKNAVRNALMIAFAAVGLVAHTAFLYYHQLALESGKIVNSVQGFFFLAAWGLVCLYLFLACFHPKIPFGLFLLPLVLILIAGGTHWAKNIPFSTESVGQVWRMVHGLSLLLATLSVLLGFVCGLMYFVQQHRLKHKRLSTANWNLPTLEWSYTACRHGIGFSTMMLAIGIFSGLLLNQILRNHGGPTILITDPLVGGTLMLFMFVVAFFAALAAYRPPRENQHVAALTILCFLFLVSILVYALVGGNAHWMSVV